MRSHHLALALAVLPASLVAQAPQIYNRGILNAASYMPAGLPAGSIARGALFTIFGARMGPDTSPGLAFPLSNTLGGVSVQVKQGNTTVAAIPVFVSAGQINAIMPSNAPLGAVSVYVKFGNFTSPPARAQVVADSFGIFSINGGGAGPGAIQNVATDGGTPVNLPSVAAQPGQAMILYGTGLGAGLNADNIAPQAGDLPTKVEVFVGGVAATQQYSGRSPCCAGLDQVVFTVPANAPLGCWVPVQVRTAGVTVSNTTTVAISGDGSPCTDSANSLTAPFLAGQKIGLIGLLRTDMIQDVGLTKPGTVTTDGALLTFQQENPAPAAPFNAVFSLPPPGSCTAYTSSGDLFDGDPLVSANDSGMKFLNAGSPLKLAGAGDTRNLLRTNTSERNLQPIGYTYTGLTTPSTLLLNPGNYTLSGPGGADIGSFQAAITIPNPAGLTWSNRDQTSIINRAQGFSVSWTGAPADQSVIVFGGSVDLPSNASAIFVCLAPPNASSFTVPPAALANIAPTRTSLLKSKGAVYVGALPTLSPVRFTANGLDTGAVVAGAFSGKTVIFQ